MTKKGLTGKPRGVMRPPAVKGVPVPTPPIDPLIQKATTPLGAIAEAAVNRTFTRPEIPPRYKPFWK